MKDTTEKIFSQKPEKNQAKQVINTDRMSFEFPHPDVGVARIDIANAAWVNTVDGIVVIDTLLNRRTGRRMADEVKKTGAPVKYIIYTHGHNDHVGGADNFLADHPEIIGHRYLAERLEKYTILAEHQSRIAAIQFNVPDSGKRHRDYVYPTLTYDEAMSFSLGNKTFELYHARAETDDHTWVFVPEIETVFVGDLIIAGFPNIGNPFKPTRFALPWARALEKIRDKKAQMLVAHGGRAVYKGDQVEKVLSVNIEAIYSIHNQVVAGLNNDVPIDELIHQVQLPDHLKDDKHLRFLYSRPEFAVYNIYRWYHGYFDHNPAHLLPRPEKEVNQEIFSLIGDPRAILDRAEKLADEGQPQLAIQVLDVLLKSVPDHKDGRRLHLRLLETLCEEDYCLMSRNTWVYFMNQDRKILGAS